MKLRNKKTGEVVDFEAVYDDFEVVDDEWPKDFWYINSEGEVKKETEEEDCTEDDKEWIEELKEFGNYFLSLEEAKKAVNKLKAYKRLKDKGFRFNGYDAAHNSDGDLCCQLFYNAGDYILADVEQDLDMLFGDKE